MIPLLRSVKEQPLPEKLFFFSLVVMVGASTLPWVRGHAGVGEHNAWQLGLREQLAMLVPVAALVLRLMTLGGLSLGPLSDDSRTWLRWYRFAFLCLAAVLILDLVQLPMKAFGFWLTFMALFIQAYSLRGLLAEKG